MDNEQRDTLRSYFQSLRLIHAALLVALIAFLAVVRFVVLDSATVDAAQVDDPVLRFTPTVVLLLGILAGEFFFQRRVKEAREAPTLAGKLTVFRGASIVRWVALSAPALFALIWFMLFADKFFMAIGLVGMALLAFSRPSVARTGRSLQLSEGDEQHLDELLN